MEVIYIKKQFDSNCWHKNYCHIIDVKNEDQWTNIEPCGTPNMIVNGHYPRKTGILQFYKEKNQFPDFSSYGILWFILSIAFSSPSVSFQFKGNYEITKSLKLHTAQKMKFSIKDFFSKCDQICRKLQWHSCAMTFSKVRLVRNLVHKSVWNLRFFIDHLFVNYEHEQWNGKNKRAVVFLSPPDYTTFYLSLYRWQIGSDKPPVSSFKRHSKSSSISAACKKLISFKFFSMIPCASLFQSSFSLTCYNKFQLTITFAHFFWLFIYKRCYF